ncbi:MAG: HNH endonuclease [Bryobacteraceae bacterium]
MSEPADSVRRRAGGRCEHCRLPQSAFRRAFHIEHIVARQHGGLTAVDNLALACWELQSEKGSQLVRRRPTDLAGHGALPSAQGGALPSAQGRVGGAFFGACRRPDPARCRDPRANTDWAGDGSGTCFERRNAADVRYELWLEGMYTIP